MRQKFSYVTLFNLKFLYDPFHLAQIEYNQQGFRQEDSCIVSFFISVTFLAIPMIL